MFEAKYSLTRLGAKLDPKILDKLFKRGIFEPYFLTTLFKSIAKSLFNPRNSLPDFKSLNISFVARA